MALPGSYTKESVEDYLRSTLILPSGWDSYSADPPNEVAVNNAVKILNEMPYLPIRALPTVVGGIALTYQYLEQVIFVEFYNDGSVCSAKWADKKRELSIVRELQLEEVSSYIKEHIGI